MASSLMPAGVPSFTGVVQYPMISKLIELHSRPVMLKAVFILVRDLCNSVNVVRNMDEDQMIDAAAMLLDECGNFRMEDYLIMFTMAKRGQLSINDGKGIMDRIDLEVIGKIVDAYWEKRNAAAKRVQDDMFRDPDGSKLIENTDNVGPERVAKALGDLARQLKADKTDPDNELLKHQQAMRQRAVVKFVDSMIAGRKMESDEDLQFYENNKEMIETLLSIARESDKWANT